MTTMQKAIILGILTEAIAASFVVIDAHIGIAAAHDTISLQHAPRAFYFLAQWTHWPAVIVLGILDALVEAALGFSGGEPVFFDGFASGNPAWTLICLTQMALWIGFWAAVLGLIRYIHQRLSNNHKPA